MQIAPNNIRIRSAAFHDFLEFAVFVVLRERTPVFRICRRDLYCRTLIEQGSHKCRGDSGASCVMFV
ncbi:MAG: hypothetical protein OXH09_08750 [Gammaproteobacteria bacterium]|nr:hypothetical protein [Gammaproteobacteria bacterium]